MTVLQWHQTTLLDDESDLRLTIAAADPVGAEAPERPRDTVESLLDALGVEDVVRVPPFFLPSVIASLLVAAAGAATREEIPELWFSAGALVDPAVPEHVRRFAGTATALDIVSLGQSLAATAAVASTGDAALLGGFFAGSDRPLAALALPANVVVCVAGASGADAGAATLVEELEAWLARRSA